MPYYRIIVWVRNSKRIEGIRFLEITSLSAVQGVMHRKAEGYYGSNFIDCEVHMLAKTCTAVKKFLADKKKKKDRQEWANYERVNLSRKESFAKNKDLTMLGERKH